jgi:uncharacterized DUF497 family protein
MMTVDLHVFSAERPSSSPVVVYVHLMYTLVVTDGCEFHWDEQNEAHLGSHGISRSDAEDVLSGSHHIMEYQMEENEERWVAVGATRAGRILVIVFAVRGEAIRPITGWTADKKTADLYVREWGLE